MPNDFAGGFLIIFLKFLRIFPPNNEWSVPQSAPRKARTSSNDDRQLLLIQL